MKEYNAFKKIRWSNAIRIVSAVCGAAILVLIILTVSLPENRAGLFSWLGFARPNITKNNPAQESDKELGLSSNVTVNGSVNVRPVDRNDHLWGPIDAPVTMIVYDDFECPFCAQLYETINRAKAEFGNNLLVVVRNFPLISHEQAIPAALAAECAADQAKYWEMYHKLFEANKSGKLVIEQISADAQAIGLDMTVFTPCLTNEKYKDKIMAEKAEVKDLGIIGTPASFINGQYLSGALPYEDFTYPDNTPALGLRSLIQKELSKKQ